MKFTHIVLTILVAYSLTVSAFKDGHLGDYSNNSTEQRFCESVLDYDISIFECIDGILCVKGMNRCGSTCYNPSLNGCCGDQLTSHGAPCKDIEAVEDEDEYSEQGKLFTSVKPNSAANTHPKL
ncbi:hypothetical protein K450DRAFT_272075 [Umbelopsis ramanniana AG]|uniref:Uncharacterized protein n=1 Tax=Umbelopsis ramanniana AG TaxID=1314678 RepID=A0AAD5E9F6_UMBRA|nr:uncharacterized protein K450DRAFT_272075 [Umbelopsis ramanniana AG]KAI8579292.1 hypothetical protein K450DRAFT_272075 [Umbelopsis ramanniana AG]